MIGFFDVAFDKHMSVDKLFPEKKKDPVKTAEMPKKDNAL
jgi:hypothetical protein